MPHPLGREPLRARAPVAMPDLIQALGTRAFGPAMAALADRLFGGHVCFAYRLQDDRLTALAAGHVPPDPTDVLLPNMWRYTVQGEWRHDACLDQALVLASARSPSHFHDVGGWASRRHWPWDIPTPLIDKLVLCECTVEGHLIV